MIKNILLIILFFNLVITNIYAGDVFGTEKILPGLRNGGDDLVLTTNAIFTYLIGLLYFIAVIIGVYGGFKILTSGGEEDNLKKGKNYILYMVLGLIVIFLASILIRWVIGVLTKNEIVGG